MKQADLFGGPPPPGPPQQSVRPPGLALPHPGPQGLAFPNPGQPGLALPNPGLSGLAFIEEAIGAAEERDLIAAIDGLALAPFRFQGWLGKRLTLSFGWNYDFDTGQTARADPIPAWLLPLRQKAASFAGLPPDLLEQVLLIRYDPGAGIGWHRDRPVFGHVLGVSLGVPAVMRFRRRTGATFERRSVPLPPRSLYHLTGEARHTWEHSIAAMEVTRWSITFRSLSRAFPS